MHNSGVSQRERKSEEGSTVLYNLLRPEFVRRYKLPLRSSYILLPQLVSLIFCSSDSFTGFGQHNALVHNREVRLATDFLKGNVIPKFVERLESPEQREHLRYVRLFYLSSLFPVLTTYRSLWTKSTTRTDTPSGPLCKYSPRWRKSS